MPLSSSSSSSSFSSFKTSLPLIVYHYITNTLIYIYIYIHLWHNRSSPSAANLDMVSTEKPPSSYENLVPFKAGEMRDFSKDVSDWWKIDLIETVLIWWSIITSPFLHLFFFAVLLSNNRSAPLAVIFLYMKQCFLHMYTRKFIWWRQYSL